MPLNIMVSFKNCSFRKRIGGSEFVASLSKKVTKTPFQQISWMK
jgi:hypothetical protein